MVELENQRLSLVERPGLEDEMVSEGQRSFSASSRSTWIHMQSFSRTSGYHSSGVRTTRYCLLCTLSVVPKYDVIWCAMVWWWVV